MRDNRPRSDGRAVRMSLNLMGILLCLASILSLYSAPCAARPNGTPFPSFRFAGPPEAEYLLASRDSYVAALSPFDRSARMKSAQPVTEEEFLRLLKGSALAWKDEEIEKFEGFIPSVGGRLSRLRVKLPDPILLIKTSGVEEGSVPVAYTRRNAIIFTEGLLKEKGDKLERIFVHELFHILSRTHPALRDELYRVIGFSPCKKVRLPRDLSERRISNPDAPPGDYAITISYKGSLLKAVPTFISPDAEYDPEKGEDIFQSGAFKLLVIEEGKENSSPELIGGQPMLLNVDEVSGFYEKVGKNTTYINHPEEILAENFELLVNEKMEVPTPRILLELKRILFV